MKLSIISVNLNNKIGLDRTISSVINQTFSDFEFIVIDAASTDGSVDLIKQHADKITFWISEPDSGIYHGMNKGIKQAKGDYCLFLNSGDWLFDTNTLENIFNLKFEEDIVYGDRMDFSIDNNNTKVTFPDMLTLYNFYEYTIGHQSTLIKRILFSTISLYNENSKFDADWEFFMLCLSKHNCTYKHLDIVFCYFDLAGISSNPNNLKIMFNERDQTFLRLFPLLYYDYKELKRLKGYYDENSNKGFLKRLMDLIEFGFGKFKTKS